MIRVVLDTNVVVSAMLRAGGLPAAGDVTVFSADVSCTYDVNQSFSRSRNSPYDGRTFRGGPVATIVNGEFCMAERSLTVGVPPIGSRDLLLFDYRISLNTVKLWGEHPEGGPALEAC